MEPKKSNSNTSFFWLASLASIAAVLTFFVSLNLFAYLKSTVIRGFFTSLTGDQIHILDLSAGSISTYQLAEKPWFLDKGGKPIPPEQWVDQVERDNSEIVDVTVRPDGKCVRVKPVEGGFFVEGEVTSVDGSTLKIGKTDYPIDTSFFIDGVKPETGSTKPLSSLASGDTVRCWGLAGKVCFIERLEVGGRVKVTSNIDGVRIFLDGVFRGQTPLVIPSSPGTRQILAKLPGYKDVKMDVEIKPGTKSQVQIDMKPVTGLVSITSDPSGAEVYFDGELKGKTPFKEEMPPGEYNVTIKLDGYYPKNFSVQVVQDETSKVDAVLTKMNSGGLLPIGGGTSPSGSNTGSNMPVGLKTRVLHTYSSLGALEVEDDKGNILRLAYSDSVPLKNYPFGTVPWASLLPGEELVLNTGPDGNLKEATRTYAHTFSIKGTIVEKNEDHILIAGDKWVDCTVSKDALVQLSGKDFPLNVLSPSDVVTLYGSSQNDIRYISVEKPTGEKLTVEGFLVKTATGLRLFNDSSMTSISIPDDVKVADPESRKIESAGRIPSGSRLIFYLNPVADVVFAEMLWKANVSLEGTIGSLSGASLFIMPSWQEVLVSDGTEVFVDARRRPYYDLKVGDIVQVAGPSNENIKFVWVENRLAYSRIVEGFMTSKTVSRKRLFAELASSNSSDYVLWPVDDQKVQLAYAPLKKSLTLREVKPGDKLRLYLDDNGKVVFGEVLEANQINLKGVYLGEKDGFYYFSGFQKFLPRKDVLILGLEEGQTLQRGSNVVVGGSGGEVNYIEVTDLLTPSTWVTGTVLSWNTGSLRLYMDTYARDFKASADFCFCDFNLNQDGALKDLFPGDRISLAIDSQGLASFAERYYAPAFKYEGKVTYAQGRYLVIQGASGQKNVSLLADAYVQRNGEKVSYWDIKTGDSVKVSGRGPEWVDIVVAGR